MARTRLALIPVVALALALAGCGGQQQEYADAIATSIQQESGGLQVNEEQAQCVGDAAIEALGVETYQQANLTPEDIRGGANPLAPGQLQIDKTQANRLFEGFDRCLDVTKLIARGIEARAGQLPPQQRQCLIEAFDKDLVRQLFVAQYTGNLQGNQQLTRQLVGAYSQCVR